jgi:hypothetical protein
LEPLSLRDALPIAITAVLCLAILIMKLRNDVFGKINR